MVGTHGRVDLTVLKASLLPTLDSGLPAFLRMIRAAISRTFLRKEQQEQAQPARQQRTLRTSKTALFQAVLGESYHFTYDRAVLALKESYPAYKGFKGVIPDYTALSDWLCHRVANTLATGFPSETVPTVERGSPHTHTPPSNSRFCVEYSGVQRQAG